MNPTALWGNFLKGVASDVDIIVNDGEQDNIFHCHKIVLASAEGYFGALYKCKMIESFSHQFRLRMTISKEVFMHVLNYIYTGTPEKLNDPSKLLEILKCARFFQLPGLEKSVEHNLTQLSDSDIVDTIKSLTNLHLLYFPHILIQSMVKNFPNLINLDEMMIIPYQAMYELVTNEGIRIKNEEALLAFVLKYIDNNSLTPNKIKALGNAIFWERIDPTVIEGYGLERIQTLIDEEDLNKKVQEFKDRTKFIPADPLFSLILTEYRLDEIMKYAKRYLSVRNMIFNIPISPQSCTGYHLKLTNWAENGIFETHTFCFTISFDEGYIGSFFNISFTMRQMVGCDSVHITYLDNSGTEKSANIQINPLLQVARIRHELISGELMNYLKVSVTGEKKPHAHIVDTILCGCVCKAK